MNAILFPWIPSLRRKKSMKKVHQTERITAITNARIFDGERVINDQTVVINGASIGAVGGAVPAGAALVNAQGATLMPGLIGAHVHTSLDGLHDALAFGVTTELEMQGHWTAQDRKEVALICCWSMVTPSRTSPIRSLSAPYGVAVSDSPSIDTMNPLYAPSTFQWLVVHKAHTCFSGARNTCTI
jgi:hypothetical protein